MYNQISPILATYKECENYAMTSGMEDGNNDDDSPPPAKRSRTVAKGIDGKRVRKKMKNEDYISGLYE